MKRIFVRAMETDVRRNDADLGGYHNAAFLVDDTALFICE